MCPSPSSDRYLRVAVVQFDYHPAAVIQARSLLEDPVGAIAETLPLPPTSDANELRRRRGELRKRIRQYYVQCLEERLRQVLRYLQRWGVRLAVLPEYSVPRDLLNALASETPETQLVAGTHSVTTPDISSGCYSRFAIENGQAVAPVLHAGDLSGAQAKLCDSQWEPGLVLGKTWEPVPLAGAGDERIAILICKDYLHRSGETHISLVARKLIDCRFVAVPSLTPAESLRDFTDHAREDAKRYGKTILYANRSSGGGSSIYVDVAERQNLQFPDAIPALERDEEGVVVVDVDVKLARVAAQGATRFESPGAHVAVAAATFVYPALAADREYGDWLAEARRALSSSDEAIVEFLKRDAKKIERFAERSQPTRQRRLNSLTDSADLLTRDRVRRLLLEIEFRPETLPMGAVRDALVGASRDAVRTWPTGDRERTLIDPILASLSSASMESR